MKYLFLLQTADDGPPEAGTAEAAQMYADYQAALQEMARAGVLLECAPLQGASVATTVRVRDGRTMLTDGPAAELKEQVGGYTLVDCVDLDQALHYAATMPAAKAGSVEVRAVVDTRGPAGAPAAARAAGAVS
ncbi:MAG TPA: YciI family protein [Frankiaceae bacterium]|nr:YciI family protein [Frankiaceae bacterium]